MTLARSQRGLEAGEFVDLATVAEERLRGVELSVRARLESAPDLGDPQLVERLVVNLTDDAVRHNLPAGEGSWVSVWTGVDARGRPGLRIENSGPVIPADQAAGAVPAGGRCRRARRTGAGADPSAGRAGGGGEPAAVRPDGAPAPGPRGGRSPALRTGRVN
ncbi:hypothetical protein AB0I51_10240 [Streptomyces sp. NPDC050549]|uniref:hypothetical protein n=1 Tax=Streptomyces sp. NPDC050549 TaxID=3155406 RepID=UPI00341878F0